MKIVCAYLVNKYSRSEKFWNRKLAVQRFSNNHRTLYHHINLVPTNEISIINHCDSEQILKSPFILLRLVIYWSSVEKQATVSQRKRNCSCHQYLDNSNQHIHTTSRGWFNPKVGFFWYTGLTFWFNYNARYPRDKENSSKLLRIEMENYHIIMKMGMYWIEPPWISICLIQTY